jgi:hypothetical protein
MILEMGACTICQSGIDGGSLMKALRSLGALERRGNTTPLASVGLNDERPLAGNLLG